MFFSTRGGRCGFSAHGGSSLRIPKESIHGFITASSLSIPPDTVTLSLSLPVCLARPTVASAVPQDVKRRLVWSRWPHSMALRHKAGCTYLSLHLQVCLVSYQDHREFISVFDPQDLSLEFVDFFEAMRQRRQGGVSVETRYARQPKI